MKTLLLAGGQSKRMWPIEDKCFVQICGRPLIEWQLMSLRKAGFHDILIVGNARNLGQLRDYRLEGMTIETVEQTDPAGGMKAALMAAQPFFVNEPGMLIVSSNDVVESSLLEKVQGALTNPKAADGMIVGYRVKEYFPGGYLTLDEQGFARGIVEKPGPGSEPSDLVNLVIHLHRDIPALYHALNSVQSDRDDLYEKALQMLFHAGKNYPIVTYDGFWQPVKYPWHLLRLMDFFLWKTERSISRQAEIAGTAVVMDNVVVEDGVKILDYAVVKGPAYLGKGCVVGNYALVRGSSLGDRCTVGAHSEIARCLLQNEVWTHRAYLGDSVVGENVSFGSGAMVANLRLDEGSIASVIQGEKVDSNRRKFGLVCGNHVRAGVNASFMPGVKVGSQTMIAAGLTIDQDIPDHAFVKSAAAGFEVRQNTKVVGRRG